MMIEFMHTSTPLAIADLINVEERLGFRFPEAFQRYYLAHNGGRPNKNQFTTTHRTYVVHDFLPIKMSAIATLNTLETTVRLLKADKEIIPMHLVPFAVDAFGNFFCFSVRERDFGAIYWLKMEGRRKPDGDFLSPTLDDFLGNLKARPELPEKKNEI